jgi:hypothetical protein
MSDPWDNPSSVPSSPKDIKKAQEFFASALNKIQIAAALSAYQAAPIGATLKARELSEQQAFDLLMHYVARGEIEIDEQIQLDASGKIVQPRPGQQLRVRTRMAGVDYLQAASGSAAFASARQPKVFYPVPAFAIVLYRLAKRLGEGYYRVSSIVWGGIGAGHKGKKLNCHQVGTCVDIYGAHTRFGPIDVYRDWGRRPVYLTDGKRRTSPANDDEGDYWGKETNTYYRLRAQDTGMAYYFFSELYDFAFDQTTTGANDVPQLREFQPSGRGYIIHPDYKSVGLRRDHEQHIHFQLGEAFV